MQWLGEFKERGKLLPYSKIWLEAQPVDGASAHLVLSRLSRAHSIQVLQRLRVLPQRRKCLCPAQPQGAGIWGWKEKYRHSCDESVVMQWGWMRPGRCHRGGTASAPLPCAERSQLRRSNDGKGGVIRGV